MTLTGITANKAKIVKTAETAKTAKLQQTATKKMRLEKKKKKTKIEGAKNHLKHEFLACFQKNTFKNIMFLSFFFFGGGGDNPYPGDMGTETT